MWSEGKLDWRRIVPHIAGFVVIWGLLWALGWFSPGLGCFVSFVFTFLSMAWQAVTGPVGEFREKHKLAVAAAKARVWVATEARSREGLALAQKLRTGRVHSMCGAGALLCLALRNQRRFAEAEAVAREMLAGAGTLKNDLERVCVAMTWRLLAETLLDQSRLRDADVAAARMEEVAAQLGTAKVPGRESFEAERLYLRVQLQRCRGEYREALQTLEELRVVLARTESSELPAVDLLRSVYYLETFRPDLALAALDGVQGEIGVDRQLMVLGVRGAALGEQGRWAEAEALHREQSALRERWAAPDDVRVAFSLIPLATALVWQGKDAGAILERAEGYAEKMLAEERAALEYARGLALANGGRMGEAEAALRESVRLNELHTRVDHPVTADGLRALARVVELLGRPDEAAGLRTRVEQVRRAYADVA